LIEKGEHCPVRDFLHAKHLVGEKKRDLLLTTFMNGQNFGFREEKGGTEESREPVDSGGLET